MVVSDAVVVKMLGTAHEFGADVEVAPHVVIIGGDKEPPPPAPEVVGVPFYVPVPVAIATHAHRRDRVSPRIVSPTPILTPQVFAPPVLGPSPGFGRFMSNGWIDGVGFGRFMTNAH